MEGCRGSVGISTRMWQKERSSRVSPCFSGPKTRAIRLPLPKALATRGARLSSLTTGCSALRWVKRASAKHERAIPHCLGQRGCLTSVCQQLGRADSGASFAPMRFVGGNHGELREAEISHGPRHGSDVQRIPRRHQDYVDAFALDFRKQRTIVERRDPVALARRRCQRLRNGILRLSDSALLNCFQYGPDYTPCSRDRAALRDGARLLRPRMGAGHQRQLQRALGRPHLHHADWSRQGHAGACRSSRDRS